MTKINATIPFLGFYGSVHDQMIDDAIELILDNIDQWDEYAEKIDYSAIRHIIGADLLDYMAGVISEELNIDKPDFTFEGIWSPREYNFMTDKIEAEVDSELVTRLFNMPAVNKAFMDEMAPRDGFMPFWTAKELTLDRVLSESGLAGLVISTYLSQCDSYDESDIYDDHEHHTSEAIYNELPAVEVE